MGETYYVKTRPTQNQWDKYHETKKNLVDLLFSHRESIKAVNPKPELNDGSYEMSLEYSGLNEINKLINRLAPIEMED